MTPELEELFARDPLSLSKDDLATIVVHLRKLRTAPLPKKRTVSRRKKPSVLPATGIKL